MIGFRNFQRYRGSLLQLKDGLKQPCHIHINAKQSCIIHKCSMGLIYFLRLVCRHFVLPQGIVDLSAAKAPELSPPEPGPDDWSVAPDVGPSDSGRWLGSLGVGLG